MCNDIVHFYLNIMLLNHEFLCGLIMIGLIKKEYLVCVRLDFLVHQMWGNKFCSC